MGQHRWNFRTPKGPRTLRVQLRKRRWTQSDLSRRLGVSRATVSKWIHGARTPSLNNVRRLRAVLGIDPSDWL